VAVTFYDGGCQPLTTLAWPASKDEAAGMPRLPLSFVRCVDCGHVSNSEFDYSQVPYSDKPNLMFNTGAIWSDHLQAVRDLLLNALPQQPTVVEIGCGEGHLLRALAEARPDGRYIGFDPNATIETDHGRITARAELFDPGEHLAEYQPDLLISRHVLEHLMNPLGFVQALAFAASWEEIETRLFIEVPCIDHVFAMGRTVDFFYEHNSHFTTESLERMLRRCASSVELIETSYNGEVVYGLAGFQKQPQKNNFAHVALDFCERVTQFAEQLRRQFDLLHHSGKRIAIWGGTGKAAAFINQMGLDCDRFPIVVDSDSDKAGTFVPGTGQEILFRDYLLDYPVDVIVIATQWRAADIVLEIKRCKIHYKTILIEYQGDLIDYFADEHPYRMTHLTKDDSAKIGVKIDSAVPRPKLLSTFQPNGDDNETSFVGTHNHHKQGWTPTVFPRDDESGDTNESE
jgi:SAM-dependent methyltransferase